jgi:hypothetical protein
MKKSFKQFMLENKSGDSSLHDWFSKSKSSDGKPGWVQLGGKYAGKSCAKQPGQKTKPKCGSSKMAAAMSDKEENAAARRKRAKDPNPDRKGKAINVATEDVANEDACTTKVKSRYSVWPSAYASGALVKCRKAGAANWGNKSKKESYNLLSFKDYIEENCWSGYKRKPGKKPFEKGSCVREDGVAAVAGPTNNVGSGSIAGTGGLGGEPGVNLNRKRKVILQPMAVRKPPRM